MKIIILYGPPASGKYTIGKVLAKELGYVFFHNHLTIDLLKEIFPERNDTFEGVNEAITLEMIKALFSERVEGVVYTFVYRNENDLDFIKKLIALFQNPTDFSLVRIHCEETELLQRVGNDSRKQFNKVHKPEHLAKYFEAHTVNSVLPFEKQITINNTDVSPEDSTKRIIEELGKR